MPSDNPFTAPVHDGLSSSLSGEVHSDGIHLITEPQGCTLPGYCVKCGEPTDTFIEAKYQWAPMWVRFLILLGALPFVVAYFITRKSARVHVGVCQQHKSSLSVMKYGGLALLLGGLLGVFGGLFLVEIMGDAALMLGLFGGLAMVIAGAVMTTMGQPLKVVRITKTEAVFKAVHPEVMAQL